jgi:hypothetical protein
MKLISLTFNLSDYKMALEFLTNIENICSNLKKLEISFLSSEDLSSDEIPIDTNINEKICKIIQKQNNLKAIILSSYYSNCFNSILLSLEFQKHSLIYIEFEEINFSNISFKNFINLCNLKYLLFFNCDGTKISLDQCETLKYASFKLKKLGFRNDGDKDDNEEFIRWNNDIITSLMIKYFGESLQELVLFNEPNGSSIKDISTYCPNLIKLEIKTADLSIIPYIKTLKMKILNIVDNMNYSWDVDEYPASIEVFKSLASNLPTDVKEISLNSYGIDCVKEFFENCNHCNLEVINVSSLGLEILEAILNYIERSNNDLKICGMKILRDLKDEELRLLDQIKAKGVKIEDFCSYYDYNSFINFSII